MGAHLLEPLGVVLLRARDPGPLTLAGTNSWLVGRDPVWVVDPGPEDDDHLDALEEEVRARGGLGAIAVTHDHADHSAGVRALCRRLGPEVEVAAAARSSVGNQPGSGKEISFRPLADGDRLGPLRVLSLPGHTGDHLGFVLEVDAGAVVFTGDAVLGEGSVFVSADMAGYLRGLERIRDLRPALLCPGHGPVVTDPAKRIADHLAHRVGREEAVLAAWRRGLRGDDLLSAVWGPLPLRLRQAAAMTLGAHLEKLEGESRLNRPVP